LVTPVSHLHYFSMALPLVMALIAVSLHRRPGTLVPRPAMITLFLFAALGYALPSIPVWENRREAGLPMIVSLVLLGVAVGFLWAQGRRLKTLEQSEEARLSQAA
jgi:hypothetical protein